MTDQLDVHAEAQFVLLGLLAFGLLARLLAAAFGLLPFNIWIWINLLALPAAGLAWLICIGEDTP